MSIQVLDLGCEVPLSITAAARLVPGRASRGGVSRDTVLRWIVRGVVPSGAPRGVPPVQLEALPIGRRWVTSREALQRFQQRCAALAAGDGQESQVAALGPGHDLAVQRLMAEGF